MAIHLYLDEQLTQQISEGDFSNPDTDNYNGTGGEIKDRQIFVANEQATLVASIDDIQTEIELTQPSFVDAKYIVIGTEQTQILSGGGTTNPTVKTRRGRIPCGRCAGLFRIRLYWVGCGPDRRVRNRRIDLVQARAHTGRTRHRHPEHPSQPQNQGPQSNHLFLTSLHGTFGHTRPEQDRYQAAPHRNREPRFIRSEPWLIKVFREPPAADWTC